ncbi:MAG TPA: carbon monoxide dehydrogenase subunit G [Bryobacteraceae bacterium]|nr:carbon monoxide dehydrogenase subunit G [Bryobacteraceae bacterium]
MKISGTYHIEAEPSRVYALLQDPEVLAQCMPGTDRLVKTGENEYEMRMKLLIASVSGLFEGKVRLLDHEPPHRFRMQVEGTGKIGFLKGEGAIVLKPSGSGTEVSYEGDVTLGGTIAAVGSRLIDTTSRMILKRFFEKLNTIAKQQVSSATAGASTKPT